MLFVTDSSMAQRIGSYAATFALLLAVFLTSGPCYAQDGWVRVLPILDYNIPLSNMFHAVTVANDSTVLLAGEQGLMLRSTDTGRTWERKDCGTLSKILFMRKLKGQTIIAFSDSGSTVLHSYDAGDTWTHTAFPGRGGPLAISFLDSLNGIIEFQYEGLDSLATTTDGGNHWTVLAAPIFSRPSSAIIMLSPIHVVLVDDAGAVFITTDGGNNWSSSAAQATEILSGVFFNDSVGVIAGLRNDGIILQTRDGGTTWNQVYDDSMPGTYVHVAITGPGTAIAVGTHGKLCRTTNYGGAWTALPPLNGDELLDADFSGGTGAGVDFYGATLFSNDSGKTWLNQDRFNAGEKTRVAFYNLSHGALINRSGDLYLSEDSGKTWFCYFAPLNGVIDCLRIGDSLVFGLGAGRPGTIYRSTDAGHSWNSTTTAAALYRIRSTESRLFVAGDHAFLVSIDSGQTWNTYPSQFSDALDMSFSDSMDGILVDQNQTLVETSDGGQSWTNISASPKNIHSCILLDDTTMIVLTDGGVSKSSDGGKTWSTRGFYAGVAQDGSIAFSDPRNGLAVGLDGAIIRTTDGGTTWQDEQSGYSGSNVSRGTQVYRDFHGVAMPDSLHAFVGGSNGILLSTKNGGFLPLVGMDSHVIDFGTIPVGVTHDSILVFSNPSSDTLFLHQEQRFGSMMLGLSDSVLLPRSVVTDTILLLRADTGRFLGSFVIWHDSLPSDTILVKAHVLKLLGVGPSTQSTGLSISLLFNQPDRVPTVEIQLGSTRSIHATITNLLGRTVGTLFDGILTAGSHELPWFSHTMAPGTYFIHVTTSDGDTRTISASIE